MILCAGLGTRLRPLTDELPKPLVPVGDRPAVAGIAEGLRAALPALRLVVNAHHRAGEIRRWAEPEGIAVSEEQDLLGTAGGVAAARRLLGDDDDEVLVWNGDILSDLDPAALLRRHDEAGAEATLAVARRPAGEGNVGLDAEGRLVRLRKERFAEEVSGADFLGVHVIGPAVRRTLPSSGCLVGDVYLPRLRSGAGLASFEAAGDFLDVGTLAAYLAANRRWLARRGLRAFVHPTAHVATGVAVTGSVVGAGARVLADVHGAVIWPGAEVREACAGVVVTTRGVVSP